MTQTAGSMGMVFGPGFRLVRTLPSVPELLIWADNAYCQQGTTNEPIDGDVPAVAVWPERRRCAP